MSNSFEDTIGEISVEALARRMAESQPLQLVDVREPQELELAQVEGFINLPLSQFADWSSQINQILDPHAETLVLCHHGLRSAQMCQWLASQGFTQVKNIVGGIQAYSIAVDRSIPQY